MADVEVTYVNVHLPVADRAEAAPRDLVEEKSAGRDLRDRVFTLATRVIDAVYSHRAAREYAIRNGFIAGDERPRYLLASQVTEVGPPEGVPILVPEIGLLTVPAPDADVVISALKSLGPDADGITVEPVVVHRTAMDSIFVDDDATAQLVAPSSVEMTVLAQRLPWGVARVNAPAVWQRGYRGQGIRVAIVDSGCGPHVDLPRRVAGATFVPNSNSPDDDRGHGTHVAGTVLAVDNAFGVVGVAPAASFIVAKVLNSGGRGNDSWIAAGIIWAANQGADVINLSLGGGYSRAIEDAVAYAFGRGVVIPAAAGNDYCSPVIHPASSRYCIAVAATNRSNQRASFSNCGNNLDIAAPGSTILSTTTGDTYGTKCGTSMATPHVSGVCALVLSQRRMPPAELKTRLQDTALRLGPWNHFGAGLVQADRAIS